MARISDELKPCAAVQCALWPIERWFRSSLRLSPIELIPKHFSHSATINTNAKHIQIIYVGRLKGWNEPTLKKLSISTEIHRRPE